MTKTTGIFEVSRALGVSERTIHRLCDHGMPRAGRGRYDLAQCMLWFIRYQARKIAELDRRDGGPEARIREQRIRLMDTQANIAEHEVKRLHREYLNAKGLDRTWKQIERLIVDRVQTDYRLIAPFLEGETRQVIEAKLEDQARKTLTALAKIELQNDGARS